MLSRRRGPILILVGLISLNILLSWFLERLWKDYRSRTQWLHTGASAEPLPTLAAGPSRAGPPQSFVEIVDRNVFSPLRGSAPAQPQEEAKAPKPPILFGTMNLGDGWFALMAPGDQPSPASKRVLPGEEIGGNKLVSIGTSNVVMEWQEKRITVDVFESARRPPGMIEKTAAPSARSTPVTTSGNVSAPTASSRTGGAAVDSAARPAALLYPDAPVGAVINGKRKTLLQTPFGKVVVWQDVGQANSEAPAPTGNPNK